MPHRAGPVAPPHNAHPAFNEWTARFFIVATLAIASMVCVWQCSSVHWDPHIAAQQPVRGW